MSSPLTNHRKANILVVDDTPANLRLLAGLLTDNGYKVRPVINGELAINAARGFPPDLVLLDIMMPEMDGYQVCQQLKANEKTKDIPIIFVSAINEIVDKVKAFSVGGVDYITKPFQVEEVLARVKIHLEIRQLQKSLTNKNEELAKTLEQLQATQKELVQREKMAALGQLIAGVAHEINTPLGAIRSSIGNIADFLQENLPSLPKFFQELSPERQADFTLLLNNSIQQTETFSTREKRQIKRSLKQQLESYQLPNADSLASLLFNLGIERDIEPFLSLLNDPQSENIIKMAFDFASLLKSTRTITAATDRAAKIVFALKTYARYDSLGEKVKTDISEGIKTVLTLYHNSLKQGVEAIANYEELPPILCYPDELNQVWTNLVHNALQAMQNKGTLKIEAKQQDNYIKVSITDSGKGIPEEIMPRIFEPFFTTKPPGEGSGMGLDIVKKIIDKHQGNIEVQSSPGQTTFTVYLPIDPDS
jgi:two-component system, NtrC family, sensor kinase